MFLMSNECGQFQIDPVAKAGGFLKQIIEEFKLNVAMILVRPQATNTTCVKQICFIHLSSM